MKHLDSSDQVTVNPRAFSWVNQLEVKPARVSFPETIPVAKVALAARPSLNDPSISPARRKTPIARKKIARPILARGVAPAALPAVVKDVLSQTQAVAVEAPAQESELQMMKVLHRSLHRGFLSALRTPAPSDSVILTSQAAPKPPVAKAVNIQAPKKVATRIKLAKKTKAISRPVVPRIINTQVEIKKAIPAPVVKVESVRSTASSPVALAPKAVEFERIPSAAAIEPVRPVAIQVQELPPAESTIERHAAPQLASPSSVEPAKEETPIASAAQTLATPAVVEYTHSLEYPQPLPQTSDYSKRSEPVLSEPHVAPYVQAFHWEAGIADGYTEVVSHEVGVGGEETGWRVSKAFEHWPTLHWNTGKSIPLVSHNTALFLGALLKTTIQSQTGIVFGQLPAGWTAEISARAESFLMNRFNQVVDPALPESPGEQRYFVFVNTEPGTHLVHLVHRSTGNSVAIVIPTLAGTSTFLEGVNPTPATLSGIVLDGSASEVGPVPGAAVSIVGQEKAHARANARGQFWLENALTWGNYPLFVQTDAESGYTHRYRVLPGETKNLQFYRLSKEQTDEWIQRQLTGGVSRDSGLLVAALPKIAASFSEEALFPSVSALLPNQTLQPETYTVSPRGQLLVNTPLIAESPRFLGAQVPEGLAIAQVEDRTQKVIWSELVPASPGVVNLIGPY
jgi:hypothetical protein